MKAPPDEIGSETVLYYAIIDERCHHTGKCKIIVADTLMGPAQGLVICTSSDTGGYYIFYCDENWNDYADGWAASLDEAMKQAEFEYEGISNCWVKV